jgi:hypothetical protein
MRASNLPLLITPTFSPKPRRMPRRLLSTSRSLATSSLRAVSRARISCTAGALTWTGRNQPMRISCAMPRASFLSVFTVIAWSAALTWRVSIKIAGSPASASPASSHCDNGPAFQPDAREPQAAPFEERH